MTHRFDLTIALTYYSPYTSGLTEVARTVATGLAARGWRVAVVATRHDSASPQRESHDGVEIFRTPVLAKVGRGVLSPGFATTAGKLARDSAVLNVHLPMLEAGLVARRAGATPIVCHHHDDVWLSAGLARSAQIAVVERSVAAALRRSTAVVVSNVDHASHSRHWPLMDAIDRYDIAPACRQRPPEPASFRDGDGPHIGFLGRIAPEKGLHHLVRAFGTIENPRARLLIAGDSNGVAGGGVIDRLRVDAAGDDRVHFLGRLSETEIAQFHASLDVFALPSVAEESFGIAQTEAMMAGVPVVASDLPGMRVPVRATGFGRLVPAGDPVAMAPALIDVAATTPQERATGSAKARRLYSVDATIDQYEAALTAAIESGRDRIRR